MCGYPILVATLTTSNNLSRPILEVRYRETTQCLTFFHSSFWKYALLLHSL